MTRLHAVADGRETVRRRTVAECVAELAGREAPPLSPAVRDRLALMLWPGSPVSAVVLRSAA